MSIKKISLDQFADVNPEGVTKSYSHDQIEYIDISSVGSGYLVDSIRVIPLKEAPSRAKRIIRTGDTILSTVRPNLRSFLFVKDAKSNSIASTGFAVLRAKSNADPRFIYYAVTDSQFTGYLTNNTKGTSYPAVDSDTILRGEVPDFHLQEQKRIGKILSSYDDLIENNRRRIQLLEQSARLLYKEWFISLRFPGHEHVKINNGVPEGWERTTLGEFAPLKYGKALKADSRVFGQVVVYGSSGIVGHHDKSLVSGPAIILGRKGNVGSVYWSPGDCWPIDTVYYIKREPALRYLFYALLNMPFISTDVAVPGLNRDFAHSLKLLMPGNLVLGLFEEIVVSLHRQIETLEKQITSLAKARDILLPRLMSGEVVV